MRDRVKSLIQFVRFAWRLWQLQRQPLWEAAAKSVDQILTHDQLNACARREERTAYCPRCGQIPDGDRRMDEARELTIQRSGEARRVDIARLCPRIPLLYEEEVNGDSLRTI